MMRALAVALFVTGVAGVVGACGSSSHSAYQPPALDEGGAAGVDASADVSVDAPVGHDASLDVSVSTAQCLTTFRYAPPAGTTPKVVQVTGDWNQFANPGVAMAGPDSTGAFTAQVPLDPGLVAYKFLVDGQWTLDPAEHWQKYVGGTPNSAVQVTDCHLPTLALSTNTVERPSVGQGHYTATVAFVPGQGAPPMDPSSVEVTLRKDGQTQKLTGVTPNASASTIGVDVPALVDGKYTVFVTAKDLAGQATQNLRLVFWVEAQAFSWQDALIYMVMTDRFVDGNPANDPAPITAQGGGGTVTVDPREDYHGGDIQGVTQQIEAGTFDQLGVSVLWLSPFYTNPPDAWVASDDVHYVSGFHGYWPIKARQVDPRFGTEADLKAMVTAAHAHGIRVIEDLVVQHVHSEHEYLAQHPTWFNTTGCICGTNNCDWTVHRLDCLFTSYLPNIDWTNTEGAAQQEADAIWWLDTFDLDGFRMDAVKQVPDIAIINLVSAVRGEFEASGTRVFMTGETAMGWVDDTLADNLSQYQLISQYIDPDGLDGQFDFVLYYAVPLNVFATTNRGMIHADYWTQASGWEYPQGAIMSPYVGSQDTARFITIASYQGQDAAHDPSIPYNQWTNIAGPPPSSNIYGEHRLAQAWLLGLPGAPMIYYGDEYGEYGGVDPNNRVMWRGNSGSLSPDEQATLAFVRKAGTARHDLPAMRRGQYVPVYNTSQDVLVFARQDTAGDVALEALSRLQTPTTVTTALPASLGIAEGATLHDHMGGPDVKVSGGAITLTLGAQSAAILAP
jgi:glycosidase